MSETTAADSTAAEAAVEADAGAEALGGPEAKTGTDDTTDTGNGREDGAQPQDDAPEGGKLSREAAKWRTKFRDAEQQIAGQTATIERLQRLHVDAAITAAGVKPAAVHALTELADLVGEDGLPDADKITAAVAKARDELGITKPNPIREHRRNGLQSGAGVQPPARDGWAAAFGPQPDR